MKRSSLLMSVALALGLAACDHNSKVGVQDAGCQDCCTPACDGRTCGDDGCGGSCGTCAADQQCNVATGACECAGETDAALCGSAERNCGSFQVTDRCGRARTVVCGTCNAGDLCNAEGQCELCVNEGDTAFCDRLQKDCGTVSDNDNCGDPRSIDCGGCEPHFACSIDHTCEACTSETDQEYCARNGGLNCGALDGVDNCNVARTFNCGTCEGNDVCEGNRCGPCVAESDQAFCARHAHVCGSLTEYDNCGGLRAVANCGTCAPTTETCSATGTCILCTPEDDAQLCAFYFKDCGTPSVVDHCGVPRTPSCGSTCSGELTCQANGVCGTAGVPTNDTCATPERLVFDAAGHINGTGDLTGSNDNSYGPCGGAGRDVYYVFDLLTPKIVTITLTPSGAGNLVGYLRQDCNDWMNRGCGQASGNGQPVTFASRVLAAGTWYLAVDSGWGSVAEPFSFSITAVDPPPVPANDTCLGAQVIAFSGTGAVRGDTTSAIADYADSCGWALLDGQDVVYKFTLNGPHAVFASVEPDPSASNFAPALELLDSCPSSGTSLACGTNSNGLATLSRPNLAAGDYYLIVDANGLAAGAFTLHLSILPPVTNDLCPDAIDIPLVQAAGSGNLVGTAQGDTSVANDDYTSSCNGYNTGRDVAYKFTVPAGSPKNVQIDVIPAPNSPIQPMFFVKTDCAAADEVVCASTAGIDQTVSTTLLRPAAGIYYVIVDGWAAGANGPFSIRVTASEPPPPPRNDTCTLPAVIALDTTTGVGHETGTTFPAINDFTGSCGTFASPLTGPDTVYSVTLGSTLDLSVKVTRAAGASTFFPAVYLRSACADATTEIACGLESNGTATATARNLAAGTYFIFVDGIRGTAGDFTLDVFAYAPLTNDSCTSPRTLAFDNNGNFVAHGDSCSLANDSSASNNAPCYGAGGGNDLVYKLVTTQVQDLELTFDPGHETGSQIYVRTDCATSATEFACKPTFGGGVNSLKLKNLPGNTYYIWLDNNYACGIFAFTAHLTTPPPPQSNDLCATPQWVNIDNTSGIGTASGNTDAATNDSDGSCRSGNGAELVYAFNVLNPRTVEVKVTPRAGSALQPVVYVRTTCAAASEMACRAATAVAPATLQFPRLGVATYSVFVDAWDRDASGPFDLTITTTDPGAVANNDICASPTAIPAFDPTTHKALVTGNTLAGYDNDTSNCATTAAPLTGTDLVYRLTLPTARHIKATLAADASAPNYHPALSIRSSCALGDEVACALESSGSATVESSLAAGDWYLFVDGTDGSFGAFTLTVDDLGPGVAADGCGNVVMLDFNGGTSVSATGDLNGVTNHGDPGCTNGSGSDLVYAFTLPTDAFITASVTPVGLATFRPIVALRRTCDMARTEFACYSNWNTGAVSSVTSGRMKPGTYYVVVDSNGPTSMGGFTVNVELALMSGAVASNDTCAAPTPLQFDTISNTARVTGDTRNAYDDYGGSCGSSFTPLAGGDLVYSFSLAQAADVVAAVTRDPSTPNYLPAIYLRTTACDSADVRDEKGCYTTSWSPMASITARSLPAGDYWIVVDGQGVSAGRFTLDVAVHLGGYGNMGCMAAAPMQFDLNGVAEALGDTTLALSQMQGSPGCGTDGPELYYSFTTTAVRDVVVEVIPGNSSYAPAVHIRKTCSDPATQKLCDSINGGALKATAVRLPADSYTLIVDGAYGGSSGPFILRVTQLPPSVAPTYDACRSPRQMTLPASQAPSVVITDSTLTATDDYTSRCATASAPLDGPDVVYAFNVATAAQVTAKVTPKATSPRYKPAVYIRRACATIGDDLCAAPGGAGQWSSATVKASLAPGDYFLIVDGIGGTAGEYDLELSQDASAYVAGDHCINAKSIDSLFVAGSAPTEQVATITGTIDATTNDGDGGCQANSAGDLFYTFTVLRDSFVSLEVRADLGSSYSPYFYVRSSCSDVGTERFCKAVSTGAATSGALYHLPAGTYYLGIDGYAAWQSGAFTAVVSVRDSPSAPANDACTGAISLPLFGTGTRLTALMVNQDSRFATNDMAGSCAASAGNDVVYRFTVANGAHSFTATITPAPTAIDFAPVVYLRTTCDQASELFEAACAAAVGSGPTSPVTITVNSLPAGTYYLVVDGTRASASDPAGGQFSIDAAMDAPIAGPANDSCAFAQTLPLTGPAPSVTTLTAQTTVGALDNSGSTCGAPGPDVVYRIEVPSASELKVKVTPSASGTFFPAVYVRRTCGGNNPASEIACAANASAATAVEATRSYVKAGTYFVWVDAGSAIVGNASGAFDLQVTLAVPTQIPPSNDECGAGLPQLTRGVSVTGTTVDAFNDYANPTGGACGAYPLPGPEVVYTYTPTTSGPISVQLTSNATDLMPWMAEAVCGDVNACVIASDNGSFNGVDTFTYPNGQAGVTYYIYVDSYLGTNSGSFTLVVN